MQEEHIEALQKSASSDKYVPKLIDYELDNMIGGYLDYFFNLANSFLNDPELA